MGSHRAERPARTGLSETPQPTPYVGRRCAVRSEHAASAETTTSLPRVTASLADDVTAELPLVRSQTPGKRKAVKHAGSRGPLFRGLPSPPVLLGVATLAIAVSGVVVSGTDTTTQLTSGDRGDAQVRAAGAAGGVSAIGSVDTLRGRQTSRSASRDDGTQTDDKLIKAAEAQVEVRSEELGQLAAEVEQQAKKLADNRWVMPLTPVVLTARYGEYGLWSSYHTGLDFNGNTGDPISAIAGGVVTFVGNVRDHARGRSIRYLEYEAYPEMAEREMQKIADEAGKRWPGARVAIAHRTGHLEIGEAAVVIAAAAPHRAEAFEACRFAIDTLKRTVPIWKKEVSTDGEYWVDDHA